MDGDLGDFLRSRRARIRPEEVGLPSHGRRRVPGLRREEVAQLAGVSVDYYIRVEQGRGPSVSDAVLDAIARVLRLDETERAHLHAVARPRRQRGRAAAPAPRVRPGVQVLLDGMDHSPAFVMNHRMDILAWNALADAVFHYTQTSPEERNIPRHVFLDPTASASTPSGTRSPRSASPTCGCWPAGTPTTPDSPRWSANSPSGARTSAACGRTIRSRSAHTA